MVSNINKKIQKTTNKMRLVQEKLGEFERFQRMRQDAVEVEERIQHLKQDLSKPLFDEDDEAMLDLLENADEVSKSVTEDLDFKEHLLKMVSKYHVPLTSVWNDVLNSRTSNREPLRL